VWTFDAPLGALGGAVDWFELLYYTAVYYEHQRESDRMYDFV